MPAQPCHERGCLVEEGRREGGACRREGRKPRVEASPRFCSNQAHGNGNRESQRSESARGGSSTMVVAGGRRREVGRSVGRWQRGVGGKPPVPSTKTQSHAKPSQNNKCLPKSACLSLSPGALNLKVMSVFFLSRSFDVVLFCPHFVRHHFACCYAVRVKAKQVLGGSYTQKAGMSVSNNTNCLGTNHPMSLSQKSRTEREQKNKLESHNIGNKTN